MSKKEFKKGDRVSGLYAHKGKSGTIVDASNSMFVKILWDGGKRASWIEVVRLELKEEAND
jgi:hypothetical protein